MTIMFRTSESDDWATLDEMIEANADDEALCEQLRAMRPGDRIVTGGGAWAEGWIACHISNRVDALAQGRSDCDDAVANGADAASIASTEGAEEALVNAMNKSWVLDAAGADPEADPDDEWARVGLPWCAAYNEAFRARAEEIAASPEVR